MSPAGNNHPGCLLAPTSALARPVDSAGVDDDVASSALRRSSSRHSLSGELSGRPRYAISLALPTETGRFPWGTFVINVSGSFVLGFLLIALIEQFPIGRLARPVIGTGFIGAYTTFSTFMVEAVLLVRAGDPGLAVAYLGASLVVGHGAAWVGMLDARGSFSRAEQWLQEEMA